MEPESPAPYPQGPATCPYPISFPAAGYFFFKHPPPPPGDPSGGVVYLRIVLSPEEASQLMGNS
jgi:hypothetical protein